MNSDAYAGTLALIHSMYELTAAGRWDDVGKLLTPDFCFHEAEGLPYGGVFEGLEGLQTLFTHVFQYWDDAHTELHDITVSEKHAIGLLTLHATSRHDGRRHALKIAEVFHLRDNRICGITAYYFDTAAVRKACGLDG